MAGATVVREYTSVGPDGVIRLPESIRRSVAFQPGKKVMLWWSPPDETVVHLVSEPNINQAQVTEWAARVNAAIDDPALTPEQRQAVIDTIPAALRPAVAAECYRTNENVSFSWVAAIADILTLDVPALLRSRGVEPEFVSNMGVTAEEMDAEIAILEEQGVLQPE